MIKKENIGGFGFGFGKVFIHFPVCKSAAEREFCTTNFICKKKKNIGGFGVFHDVNMRFSKNQIK